MKTYHIRSDMEGVTGVVNDVQVDPSRPEYVLTRSIYMTELNALLEGLLEGGAERIVVYDEHWDGRNVDLSAIPSRVEVICGKPPYTNTWAGGLRTSDSGMILHGLHSRAGSGELLNHTYEPDIEEIRINDIIMGEIGVETAIAGELGVPLCLIVGDSAGINEALELVPGVATVITKISRGATAASCSGLAENCKLIRQEAIRVARNDVVSSPWKVKSPVELVIKLKDGVFKNSINELFSDYYEESLGVILQGDSVLEVWAIYWKMKLAAQQNT